MKNILPIIVALLALSGVVHTTAQNAPSLSPFLDSLRPAQTSVVVTYTVPEETFEGIKRDIEAKKRAPDEILVPILPKKAGDVNPHFAVNEDLVLINISKFTLLPDVPALEVQLGDAVVHRVVWVQGGIRYLRVGRSHAPAGWWPTLKMQMTSTNVPDVRSLVWNQGTERESGKVNGPSGAVLDYDRKLFPIAKVGKPKDDGETKP